MTPNTTPTNTPRRFSLKLRTIPVEIEDNSGTVRVYHLQQMTGKEWETWTAHMASRLGSDGKKISNFNNIHADLISRCLWLDDNRVPILEIAEYPSAVQSELHDMCIELNALNKERMIEAKKD